MTVVFYQAESNGETIEVSLQENESFLDGLLRSGHDVPHGCKEGVCHSCMMKVTEGTPPENSQADLTPNQIEQGFFLCCCCIPSGTLKATALDQSSQLIEAKVVEKSTLNEDIFRLRVENNVGHHPGQFLTLWNANNIARSYSIASVPSTDNFIEFHIKRIENGAFSDWAWQQLNIGDVIKLQGPLGLCYYGNIPSDQPLLLSGIGTGLAPLFGIVREALLKNHTGDITLFVGAKNSNNFYLVEELTALAEKHSNLSLVFVAQEVNKTDHPELISMIEGNIYQEVKQRFPSVKGYAVFLCGAASFVKKMKSQCYIGGADMKDIHSDAFLPYKP